MIYGTCKGCLFGDGQCAERRKMTEKIKGLGITTMKWRCKWRRPAFTIGQAVSVSLIDNENDEFEPYSEYFDAFVVGMKGRRVLAYIPEYARKGKDVVLRNENGFVGLSMDHVKPRDAASEPICKECQKAYRLDGHEDYCGHATPEQRRKHYRDWP